LSAKCEYGFPVACGRPVKYCTGSFPTFQCCELHVPMMMDDRNGTDRNTIRIWAHQHPQLAEQFYPGNKFNEEKQHVIS
jgi:hypothetical protein